MQMAKPKSLILLIGNRIKLTLCHTKGRIFTTALIKGKAPESQRRIKIYRYG
jgi:hypothetical protein